MVREGRERDVEGKEDKGGWVLRGKGASRGVERERKGRGRGAGYVERKGRQATSGRDLISEDSFLVSASFLFNSLSSEKETWRERGIHDMYVYSS